MTAKLKLSEKERHFFILVQRAGFTNPFSEKRSEADNEIAALFQGITDASPIDKAASEVRQRIESLSERQTVDLNQYHPNDKSLLQTAHLFDAFYRYRQDFDQLIEKQIESGLKPVKVGFAGEALELLMARGFEKEAAVKFFSLAYQMRRAYFFISHYLIGRSPSMIRLRADLWENIFTHDLDLYHRFLCDRMEDYATLILGETGTGKGTAARAVGSSGFIPFNPRKSIFQVSFTEALVSLNLSQFPDTLIESELFGHKKGAFSGAIRDHRGAFDRCSPHGAIFLDELGDVPLHIQIKLLQVLQERTFTPMGSEQPGRFRGRVIAATNRSMSEIRDQGLFRDDFYYRLSSDVITVPPLRQRIQEDSAELDDLVEHTVGRLFGTPPPEISRMVKQTLKIQIKPDYDWPGNVRELEQCIRRVIMKKRCSVRPKKSPENLKELLQVGIENGNISADKLLRGYCYLLYTQHGTFKEVGDRMLLDTRTVKKYIDEWQQNGD